LGFGEESWERETEIGFMHSQSLRGRLVATLQGGWGVWSWDFELGTLLLHVFWLWQINARAQNECLWNSELDFKKRQCIQGSPPPALNDIGGSLQNVETRKNSAGLRSCFSVDFVMFSW
jgi:hypothetical protein